MLRYEDTNNKIFLSLNRLTRLGANSQIVESALPSFHFDCGYTVWIPQGNTPLGK